MDEWSACFVGLFTGVAITILCVVAYLIESRKYL